MGERTLSRGDCDIKATAIQGKTPGREEGGRPADLAGSVFLISKPGIATGVALAGLAGMVLADRGIVITSYSIHYTKLYD